MFILSFDANNLLKANNPLITKNHRVKCPETVHQITMQYDNGNKRKNYII